MARQHGAGEEKLAELVEFERSSRYSEAEKLALRVAERTRESGRGLDGALFTVVPSWYDPQSKKNPTISIRAPIG